MSDTVFMDTIGQTKDITSLTKSRNTAVNEQIVLEKNIFSNVFDKDIKRVYIYKKSERIAKALHMVCPAFKDCKPLRERIERISVELIDASILPPTEVRERLPKYLLSLASSLEMGKVGGFLSAMNADLILRETHHLLQEVASYEEPRLSLPDTPNVSRMMRGTHRARSSPLSRSPVPVDAENMKDDEGHSTTPHVRNSGRREAIISVLKEKGPVYIKDISTVIRDVSEKTIQRELQALTRSGVVVRNGNKRWTTYTLANLQKGQD